MIDSIIDSLKGEVVGSLTEKFGLDASQVDGVLGTVKETVSATVQKETSNGLEGVLNLFSNKDNNSAGNAILNGLTSNLTSNLTSKLGLEGTKAEGIASFIIPMVTKMFSDKVGGNESNLLSMLGGDSAQDMVKDMAGSFLKNKLGGLFGK